MNIFFISHSGSRGGGETVLIDTIKVVSEHHNVFLAIPNDNNKSLEKALKGYVPANNLGHFKYRVARNTIIPFLRNMIYSILFGIIPLLLFVKKNKIDIIYINSSVNLIGIIVARLANMKHIIHIHEHSNKKHRWTPKWIRFFYRSSFNSKLCQKIFVSNDNYLMWLKELDLPLINNSTVIYSKYKDFSDIQQTKKDIFTYGFIGSISENKNLETLLRTFNKLKFPCRILIAGTGVLKKKLEAQYGSSSVIFVGQVDEQKWFYSQLDVLVIPSINESWGLVALEAMSGQIAVMLTQNTGLTEILSHNNDCLFFDPVNDIELLDNMKLLYEIPTLKTKLIHNSISKLKRLKINSTFGTEILKTITIYEK